LPPKTALNRVQKRREGNLSPLKVEFLDCEKEQEIDARFHTHLSKETPKSPKHGPRTEKTWYLMWRTDDPAIVWYIRFTRKLAETQYR